MDWTGQSEMHEGRLDSTHNPNEYFGLFSYLSSILHGMFDEKAEEGIFVVLKGFTKQLPSWLGLLQRC